LNKVCVIGWPISHSRSPLIHNYWIKLHGLDASYEKLPVAPEDLHKFLTSMGERGFCGCNVTIPHKETSIQSVDEPDVRVKRIGALNTIFLRGGRTFATSTDGEGFFQNVKSHISGLSLKGKTVTIMGAGGAARAIVDRLIEESPETINVVNRTLDRALQIRKDFGPTITAHGFEHLSVLLPRTDLLVNTTSLGMAAHSPLAIELELLPKTAIVADIVYVPLKTHLIEHAEKIGLRTVPGLGMLLYQAVRGFELWFGVKPEVTEELHNLVAHDIDPEYRP
jgi:shikimate dehydrogenase